MYAKKSRNLNKEMARRKGNDGGGGGGGGGKCKRTRKGRSLKKEEEGSTPLPSLFPGK